MSGCGPTPSGPAEAGLLQSALREEINWQQEEIVLFGRRHLVPRLVAWHGDPGSAYTYSGTAHEPSPWTPTLTRHSQRIEALTGHTFNSVLLNLYRNGSDGMGWHADDEPELGRNPVIASVSFGATRRFKLRHRKRRDPRHDAGINPRQPAAHGWQYPACLCACGAEDGGRQRRAHQPDLSLRATSQ